MTIACMFLYSHVDDQHYCPLVWLLLSLPEYQGRTSTGTRQQCRPDALPATTNDSCGY